jgi:hypothetical protein
MIRVYQPILYGHAPRVNDLTCTYIGGPPRRPPPPPNSHSHSTCNRYDSTCSVCQDVLYPLLQYHNSQYQYTLRVLGCNRNACIRTLFSKTTPLLPNEEEIDVSTTTTTMRILNRRNGLNYGGGPGVITCQKIYTKTTKKTPTTTITDVPHPQQPQPQQEEETNEWQMLLLPPPPTAVHPNTEMDDDLEDQLAALMTSRRDRRRAVTTTTTTTTSGPSDDHLHSSDKTNQMTADPQQQQQPEGFPCYELHSIQEPPVATATAKTSTTRGLAHRLRYYDDDDDDDDDAIATSSRSNAANDKRGGGVSNHDDDKIQQMLQQYMNEVEDDVELLQVLRQATTTTEVDPIITHTTTTTTTNHERMMMLFLEPDERLSTSDRMLYTYLDRIQRVPRQVVRTGGGTTPLWSLYVSIFGSGCFFCLAGPQSVPIDTNLNLVVYIFTLSLFHTLSICLLPLTKTHHIHPTTTTTTIIHTRRREQEKEQAAAPYQQQQPTTTTTIESCHGPKGG